MTQARTSSIRSSIGYPVQAHPEPTRQVSFRAMHVSPHAFPVRQMRQQPELDEESQEVLKGVRQSAKRRRSTRRSRNRNAERCFRGLGEDVVVGGVAS